MAIIAFWCSYLKCHKAEIIDLSWRLCVPALDEDGWYGTTEHIWIADRSALSEPNSLIVNQLGFETLKSALDHIVARLAAFPAHALTNFQSV